MITEALVTVILGAINVFVGWFPALVIPTDIINSLAGIVELFATVSYFMPIGILQLCFLVFVGFHGAEFLISVINWVIAKIPTID